VPERKPDPLSEEARRLSAAKWVMPPPDELDNPGWNLNRARHVLVELAECLERAEAERERAVYLAKNLLGMIPPQAWRDQGGDDGQGHYEGDYYAERVATELEALAARTPRHE
jgi:hypothetical protein